MPNKMRIVITTGLSGSGKSSVLKAMEDIGFFCVDNLPVALLPQFLKTQDNKGEMESRIAVVMDIREKLFISAYQHIFAKLGEQGYKIEILFLEAASHILVNRFSETRREHPLGGEGTLEEKIQKEKEMLQPLKEKADFIVDSSACNVHQLKEIIKKEYLADGRAKRLVVNLYSFGYKNGVPQDADIVLDVRFLDNPHFVEGLRELNGLNAAVKNHVLQFDETQAFLKNFSILIEGLLPLYEKEGKPHLSIAFGCTGGRHRSVVIADEMAKRLSQKGYLINIIHRDIGRL